MKFATWTAVVTIAAAVCFLTLAANAGPESNKLPDIPGITTPDKTPRACVDCHVNRPEMNKDYRLTSIISRWKDGVNPKVFAKARAAAADPGALTGRHPDVVARIKTIPDDCLVCHGRNSPNAPPFAKLLHAIHLVGGEENHFLATAKGTCTNCHKLDQKTGAWRIGSGEAK